SAGAATATAARRTRGALGAALTRRRPGVTLRATRPLGLRGGGDAALGALGDVQVGVEVRARRVRLRRLRLPEVERAVDERPLVQVVPVHERHGDAGAAGATRAAGAVQVGLLVVGDRVVDDVRDVVDIDAARR